MQHARGVGAREESASEIFGKVEQAERMLANLERGRCATRRVGGSRAGPGWRGL